MNLVCQNVWYRKGRRDNVLGFHNPSVRVVDTSDGDGAPVE